MVSKKAPSPLFHQWSATPSPNLPSPKPHSSKPDSPPTGEVALGEFMTSDTRQRRPRGRGRGGQPSKARQDTDEEEDQEPRRSTPAVVSPRGTSTRTKDGEHPLKQMSLSDDTPPVESLPMTRSKSKNKEDVGIGTHRSVKIGDKLDAGEVKMMKEILEKLRRMLEEDEEGE